MGETSFFPSTTHPFFAAKDGTFVLVACIDQAGRGDRECCEKSAANPTLTQNVSHVSTKKIKGNGMVHEKPENHEKTVGWDAIPASDGRVPVQARIGQGSS